MSSVRVQVGSFVVQLWAENFPAAMESLMICADLSETYGDLNGRRDEAGDVCAVSISENGAGSLSSLLFVAQRYQPSEAGFDPGVLIVPETNLAFIGAGERLLAYDLNGVSRLWEDVTDVGFWWWDRSGDVILMAAELELAAWDTSGRKLWNTFVEPPWFYRVDGGTLHLNVMDYETQFPLQIGPVHTGPFRTAPGGS